jgi:Photosynthesis system II assembly factor YCF48
MQKVPKIVQERLQRATPRAVEAHPDADVLTAFTEQSLEASERARVMEHLARCGDCREVVALALPVTEAVAMPSSVRAARAPWLSWPVLRWAVVAAGILLVTSVGILQYKQRPQQNAALVASPVRQEEKVIPPSQSPRPAAQAPAARAIVLPEAAKRTPMRNLSRTQSAAAADQPSPSPNAVFPPPQPLQGAGSGGGIGGGVFRPSAGSGRGQAPKNNQVQPQSDAFAFTPAAREVAPTASQNAGGHPVPAAPTHQVVVSGASEAVEVQSETGRIATQNQVPGQLAQNQTELPSQKQPLNNLDVVKAKDSMPPPAQSSVAFAPTVATPHISLQKGLRSSPRWGISASGALQRSFDAGMTWEDVKVSQAALAGRLRTDSAAAYKADDQEKKIKKNENAESNSGLVFRAVAAIGPEVWAGGSGAMLYHSPDAGTHWTQVLPSEATASLTGDIISVEFSDPQHGRVATSSGEVWLTADGGQTWHKQP